MKTLRPFILLALALFVGAGASCQHGTVAPAAAVPLGDQADTSRAAERSIITDRDSKQMASLDAMLSRVPDMREEAWRSELGLMRARYGKANPGTADVDAATIRVNAWADGRVEEARSATAAALANANDLAARLALANQARKDIEAREKQSREENERAMAAKDEEIRKLNNAILTRTAYGIVGVSLLTILLAGAAVYLSPNKLSALADAGPVIVGGVLGLALAQLITRPWFIPASCTVGTLILAGCCWWAYRKNEKGKLAAALAEKAEQTQAVAAKVIPAIDETYDAMRKGAITTAEDVFKNLFSTLSTKMDKPEKAAVHAIRAEVKASA